MEYNDVWNSSVSYQVGQVCGHSINCESRGWARNAQRQLPVLFPKYPDRVVSNRWETS